MSIVKSPFQNIFTIHFEETWVSPEVCFSFRPLALDNVKRIPISTFRASHDGRFSFRPTPFDNVTSILISLFRITYNDQFTFKPPIFDNIGSVLISGFRSHLFKILQHKFLSLYYKIY